jgi:flagellar biosynthesis protein FlhG
MSPRDQADQLRKLVRDASRFHSSTDPPPRLIAVMGGKCGVGTTTIAVNLAVAVARRGQRAVLADMNVDHPEVAKLCGLRGNFRVADMLSAPRDLHELLQPGPDGLQLLAASPAVPTRAAQHHIGLPRLIDQLRGLGRHVDLVVLDVGTQKHDAATRIWARADHLLIVTTTDSDCVMNTYASLKSLHALHTRPPQFYVVVNRATSEETADDVHRRIRQSCQRFLALDVLAAGHVPEDDALAHAEQHAASASSPAPLGPAGRAIDKMAATVIAQSRSAPGQPVTRSAA